MASESYELRISGRSGLEPVQNVLHFVGGNLTANQTIINGESLIDSWKANIHGLWMAIMPLSYTLDCYQARRIITHPSAVASFQYDPLAESGSFSSTNQVDQLCPVVRLIPTMGFKSPGKIFLPSCPVGGVLNNQYTATYLTAIAAWANAIISNFGVSGKTWQSIVFSRKSNTTSLTVGWNVSARFGFQKRRRMPV